MATYVNKSALRLYKVLAEKFGKLIAEAPNEDVRKKLRKCNAQGKYVEDIKVGKEIPDKVSQRMNELMNKCINEWSDLYVKSVYDSILAEVAESYQTSLTFEEDKPEVKTEVEDVPSVKEETLIDSSNERARYIAKVERPDGTTYEQEVDSDDIEAQQKRFGKRYKVCSIYKN